MLDRQERDLLWTCHGISTILVICQLFCSLHGINHTTLQIRVCHCTSRSCHQLHHSAESRILSPTPSGFDSHRLLFERAVYIVRCPQEIVGRVDMPLLHFTWLGRQCKGHVVVTGGAKSVECRAVRKERGKDARSLNDMQMQVQL